VKAEDKKVDDVKAEEQPKAKAEPKVKEDDTPGIMATHVEVHGLSRYPMRLTEVGGVELYNGAVIKLSVDMAKSLVDRYPNNIKMKDSNGQFSLKTEKVAPDFKGVVVSNGKPSPVATDKASGQESKEGAAANKNIAKAPSTKG
jgi:hypothetical protein